MYLSGKKREMKRGNERIIINKLEIFGPHTPPRMEEETRESYF